MRRNYILKCLLILFVLQIFGVFEILARAGSGGSYRSSSSSSSYRSSSSSSYRSSSSSGSSYGSSSSGNYGGSSSGSYSVPSYTKPKIKKIEYHLKVENNGHVSVTEKILADFDITGKTYYIEHEHKGRFKPQYIKGSEFSQCCTFKQSDDYFSMYYKNIFAPLNNRVIDLNYKASNIVIQNHDGFHLLWPLKRSSSRSLTDKYPIEVRMELPAQAEIKKDDVVVKKILNTSYGEKLPNDNHQNYQLQNNVLTYRDSELNHSEIVLFQIFFRAPLAYSPPKTKHDKNKNSIAYRAKLNKNKAVNHQYNILHQYSQNEKNVNANDYYMPLSSGYLFHQGQSSSGVYYGHFQGDLQKKTEKDYQPRIYLREMKLPTQQTQLAYQSLGNMSDKDETMMVRLPVFPFGIKNTIVEKLKFEIELPQQVSSEQLKVRLFQVSAGSSYYSDSPSYVFEVKPFYRLKDKILELEAPTDSLSAGISYEVQLELPKNLFGSTWFFTTLNFIWQNSIVLGFPRGTWLQATLALLVIVSLLVAAVFVKIRFFPSPNSKRGYNLNLQRHRQLEEKIVELIKTYDREFSSEEFKNFFKQTTARLQRSWGDDNLEPVRPFLSQGVFNNLSLQLRLMREQQKIKNIIGNFEVHDVKLIGINNFQEYLSLHCEYSASIVSAHIKTDSPDATTKEEIQKALKRASVERYTEIYSFTRKKSAQSHKTGFSILKGQCPACGNVADITSNSNKCKFCGGIYNSGEFDWVLSEITQVEEWNYSMPIVDEDDKIFELGINTNRQMVEDRAAYLFWKFIESNAFENNKVLRRDASEDFMKQNNAKKTYYKEPVIGAVDLLDFGKVDNIALADVHIKWSAALTPHSESVFRQSVLTMVKNTTDKITTGFATHSCPNCGAPLPQSDSITCDYCSSALPGKVNDWLLHRVQHR